MKNKQFTKTVIKAYLEEMIKMDLASEIEQHVYENLMSNGRMNKNTYVSIVNNMQGIWNEKF